MAENSKMIELGTNAVEFELYEPLTATVRKYSELKSDIATVVMFICNHCPFVVYINDELVSLTNEYTAKAISFIGISSNDPVTYPEDSPEKMAEYAKKLGYKFPYLFDETQDIAKAFNAACTPEFYVFGSDSKLEYRGRMDESKPNSGISPSGKDLRAALDNLLLGKKPDAVQFPSIGCGIKWKK